MTGREETLEGIESMKKAIAVFNCFEQTPPLNPVLRVGARLGQPNMSHADFNEGLRYLAELSTEED